jgi:hypothetical protein
MSGPGERPAVGPDAPQRPLIAHLEPDQLVNETYRPVAPARLSARTRAALWALRVFVVVLSAMVIYVFIARL